MEKKWSGRGGPTNPGVSDTSGGACTREAAQSVTLAFPDQKNPEECSVCFTTYGDSERRPRTLPCGHTFCSSCIGNMLEGGQLSCPTCRAHHSVTSVAQLPINYTAEALVKQLDFIKLTQTSTAKAPRETLPIAEATVVGTLPIAEATVVGTLPIAEATVVASVGATSQKQSTGISRKLRSLLEEQKRSVSITVVVSQEVQSQLDEYRTQLADWKTEHLHLLDSLYSLVEENKTALELLEQEDNRVIYMKTDGEEGGMQLEAMLGDLQVVKTAQEVVTTIDHADQCTVLAEDWMQKCQQLFPDVKIIQTSMKVREVTRTALETVPIEVDTVEMSRTLETKGKSAGVAEAVTRPSDPTLSIIETVENIMAQGKLKVDDLRTMSPPVKRLVETDSVFCVQEDQGGLRSSRITLENDKLYLHCLLNKPPPPHTQTLPVSEVVGALDSSSTLVFLDLCWPGSTRGRVHIRLSPDTSLARQFVLLCTGQRGHSYLNTVLLGVRDKGEPKERVKGGDYEHNTGEGGASLLPHPYRQYRKSGRAGAVLSKYDMESDKSAQFSILTRNLKDGGRFHYVIGEVESGLEVIRAAVNQSDINQVNVVDCGVVVSF